MSVTSTPAQDPYRGASDMTTFSDLLAAIEADLRIEQSSAILNATLDPVLLLEAVRDLRGEIVDLTITNANEAACRDMGKSPDEVIGSTFFTILPGHTPGEPASLYFAVIETGVPLLLDDYSYPVRFLGQGRRYDIRAAQAGRDRLVLTWRDVTERFTQNQALKESEELYRIVASQTADAVLRLDRSFSVAWASRSFGRLISRGQEEIIGLPLEDHVHRDDLDTFRSMLSALANGRTVRDQRVRLDTNTGERRWASILGQPFTSQLASYSGYLVSIRDITDEMEARLELEHRSGHDMLTSLTNRDAHLARIDDALAHATANNTSIILMTVGIDRLRMINEGMSYASGDLVLQNTATVITKLVDNIEAISRVAGDEFAILLDHNYSEQDAGRLAQRICEAARTPLTIDERVIVPTVSIGIAASSPDMNSAELMRQSSLAMRQAKDSGRDRWTFVDVALAAGATRKIEIEEGLRGALDNGELSVWYQPVVRLGDRSVVGYEALARWRTASGEFINPEEFVNVAEGSRLIVQLDQYVMQDALATLRTLRRQHVAVNVSMRSLTSEEYLPWLIRELDNNLDIAARLRLEVTETALLKIANSNMVDLMRTVTTTGARWYADDFGVGYSNIAYLRDLPISGLKLDMSFTQGLDTGDQQAVRLAQGIVGLAHGLRIDTVAEGISTERQTLILMGQGWAQGQGYYFGKPVPFGQEAHPVAAETDQDTPMEPDVN